MRRLRFGRSLGPVGPVGAVGPVGRFCVVGHDGEVWRGFCGVWMIGFGIRHSGG